MSFENNGNSLILYQEIEQKIFAIRGAQVMIDRDLAQLYGVEPKRLGEQVKRNIERFPDSFRFQLTETEKTELVANCDRLQLFWSNGNGHFNERHYNLSSLR